MEEGSIDLDALALRGGQGRSMSAVLTPDAPVAGGTTLAIEGSSVDARVDISRTTSGYALRLRAEPFVVGPCVRCLERAEQRLTVDSREVDQGGEDDSELRSPYVDDGILDVTSWLHDAITLAVPEKVLCREDCAGLCEECGISLNEIEGEHVHERERDPRFAKLDELRVDEP